MRECTIASNGKRQWKNLHLLKKCGEKYMFAEKIDLNMKRLVGPSSPSIMRRKHVLCGITT